MSTISTGTAGVRLGMIVAGAIAAAAGLSAQSAARVSAQSEVVATVGGTAITLAQADANALMQSATRFGDVRLAQALYEARKLAINQIVDGELLGREAKVRGIDRNALVQQEITAKVVPVTEADVQTWYQANQGRVQGATLEQVREPIRSLLVQERTAEVRTAFVNLLKAKTAVQILLDPPRQLLDTSASPTRGTPGAPIELVEFTDFECPFCVRAESVLKQVLDAYGDRIRLVYRAFPLPIHSNARPAAEAAACASEQDKFWPYHDRLFAEAGKLSDADLKKAAVDLGMNAERFNACVDEHRYKAVVEADQQAGNEAGVNGTPAFFVNGRLLSGAQPFEAFKRIIDEELELKKK